MIVTLMLNPNDCPLRHFTDVSDVQTLASQAVGELAPSRTTEEYEPCPNPDPCTVTLTDPVCGALPLDIELSVTESTEADWETLPTRIPEVMTTRLDLESELTVRHLTDVTDSHSVPSHPVCPDRTIAVICCVANPMLPPKTTIDADPVLTILGRPEELRDPPINEYASDMLPNRSPPVIVTRRVPPDELPMRHRTDVSDSHSVPSHPVCPDRTIAVIIRASRPIPPPYTVIDVTSPPSTTLLDPAMLTDSASTEYASDMLPDRSPPVIATR